MCSDEDMVVRQYRGAYTSVDSTSSGTGRKNSRSSYGPRPAPVRHSGPPAPRPLKFDRLFGQVLSPCAPEWYYIVTFIFCWGRNFEDFYESLIGDNQDRIQGDAVMARTLYSVHIFRHSPCLRLSPCFHVTQRLRREVGHGQGDTGNSKAKCHHVRTISGDPWTSMSTLPVSGRNRWALSANATVNEWQVLVGQSFLG